MGELTIQEPPALTPEAFDVLRAAVTLARTHQFTHVRPLRLALSELGVPPNLIEDALQHWARYLHQKNSSKT